MKLFMFPFAGGNSSFYMSWKREFKSFIDVIPVELSGRGTRTSEPLYEEMDVLVNDTYEWISKQYDLKNEPYAFFGHSMGGLIAYELYYKLKEHNHPLPLHLFISGIKPPHLKTKRLEVKELSDDELLDEVFKLGGTSEELIENKELLDYFMPIIRSDFTLVEDYCYGRKREKLNCSITIFNGNQDQFDFHDIEQWRSYTNQLTSINYYEGDHFYLNNHVESLSNEMSRVLNHLNKQAINN